jgi:hypothetical protein
MKLLPFSVVLLLVAGCGGSSGGGTPTTPAPTVPTIPAGVSALVGSMLQQLPSYIQSTLADLQANLPRNPQNAVQINAKIALLQHPTLAAEISASRLFVETSVASTDGRQVAMAALFPEERYRSEATAALEVMARSLPHLERFMDTPYPTLTLRLWYGFKVGNSGGNGLLDMEDRTSYEGRTPASRLPYDAILAHEIAHTYIGNEAMTQFLELYAYNRSLGSSPDLATWTYTRGYAGPSETNESSALLLDVYGLIGYDAMSRAYKATYPLRPPYGHPLPSAVIDVFVHEAPQPVKDQVRAKLSRIVA